MSNSRAGIFQQDLLYLLPSEIKGKLFLRTNRRRCLRGLHANAGSVGMSKNDTVGVAWQLIWVNIMHMTEKSMK
jgi:hypothetical protein